MDYGIIGILHLILVIYAVIKIFGSSAPTGTKIIWLLIVLLVPLVGPILWWFMGPK